MALPSEERGSEQGVTVYISKPLHWEAEAGGSLEFEPSLVCVVNSGPARVLWRTMTECTDSDESRGRML